MNSHSEIELKPITIHKSALYQLKEMIELVTEVKSKVQCNLHAHKELLSIEKIAPTLLQRLEQTENPNQKVEDRFSTSVSEQFKRLATALLKHPKHFDFINKDRVVSKALENLRILLETFNEELKLIAETRRLVF